MIDSSVLLAHKHTPVRGLTEVQLSELLEYVGDRFDIRAVNFGTWDPNVDARGAAVIPKLMVMAAKAAAAGRLRSTAT